MNRLRVVVLSGLCALAAGCTGCQGGGVPDPSKSEITVDRPTDAIADGQDQVEIRVIVRDTAGKPVTGVEVQLAVSGAGNELSQPLTASDAEGLTTGTLTSTVAEVKTITATLEQGGLAAQATAQFFAGPATRLVFVQQPTSAEVGAPLTPAVVVGVEDKLGNRVDWGTGISIRLEANASGAALAGATTAPAVLGPARFSNLSVDRPGRYTLTASSGSLVGATSDPFDIAIPVINGTRVIHHVTDSGLVDRPVDLSEVPVEAFVPGESGFTTYAGSGTSEGTFQVPGIRSGTTYYLRVGTDIVVTSARTVDLSTYQQGRPDAERGGAGTSQHTVLDGMAPWNPSDDLQMYSSNAGAWFSGLQYTDTSNNPIGAGATSLDQVHDYSLIAGSGVTPFLVNAASGDTTWFTQLTTRAGGYQALERATAPAAATVLKDSSANTFTSTMTAVPQLAPLPLRWEIAEGTPNSFTAFRAAASSRAHPELTTHTFAIDVLPSAAHGFYAGAPDLAVMFLTGGPSGPPGDQQLDVEYGDPYPASWGRFGVAFTTFYVDYTVPRTGGDPGATASTVENAPIVVQDLLPSFPNTALRPRVSPVVSPQIEGQTFFDDRVLSTETPALRWAAPAVGTPTSYLVRIRRFAAGPTGGVQKSDVARIVTTATEVTVPPGILRSGNSYVIRIVAQAQPGVDPAVTPLRLGWPSSSATSLSGLLSLP